MAPGMWQTLDPMTPVAAGFCLALALATARVLMHFHVPPSESGRFAAIDGLRGFLAFGVFLHHAAIWYFYLRTDAWVLPPSRLYTHLGRSSVELFFMITAFLFVRKITTIGKTPLSWQTLFVHRLFRLGPLYLVAMAAFIAIVAVLTGGQLNEPLWRIAFEMLRWIVFDVGGNVDIDHVDATGVVIGYVPWSLHYEWVFYLSLPLIALAIRRRVPIGLVLACVLLIGIASIELSRAGHYFYAFGGGAVAAYAVQFSPLRRFARSWAGSSLVVALLLAVLQLGSGDDPRSTMLLTAALTLVACGADVFGLLTRPIAFFLGETAYSLYLLHPLLLFVTFRLVLARWPGAWASPLSFWLVVGCLTPLLVSTCVVAFRRIERPGIEWGRRVDDWIGRWRARRRRAAGAIVAPAPH